MTEDEPTTGTESEAGTTVAAPETPAGQTGAARRRRRAASRPAGPPTGEAGSPEAPAAVEEVGPDASGGDPGTATGEAAETTDKAPAPRRRSTRTRRTAPVPAPVGAPEPEAPTGDAGRTTPEGDGPADAAGENPADVDGKNEGEVNGGEVAADRPPGRRRRTRKPPTPAPVETGPAATEVAAPEETVTTVGEPTGEDLEDAAEDGSDRLSALAMPLFQAPDLSGASRRRRAASRPAGPPQPSGAADTGEEDDRPDGKRVPAEDPAEGPAAGTDVAATGTGDDPDEEEGAEPGRRRRRRRGGRGRRGRNRDAEADDGDGTESDGGTAGEGPEDGEDAGEEPEQSETGAGSRRRRRRRRRGNTTDAEPGPDDPPNTVVKVREGRRGGGDDVTGVRGSTRLEAKRQRRREGREAGRRKPVITEAEFLARRESVERVMVMREQDGRTQIGVLEDGVLVEHYVARRTQISMVGNVYLGKVQNVLPSMEAAFVDIGKGRNAVLYAGEVNWDAAGLEGQPKRIEHALKSGESVLVQVTKDPIGHKGARLTSQVSLPGRYLVYVPDGSMTGISRKLPDTERTRLKKILRAVVADDAGVIVRTAAEGASEEELERDVARLAAQWADIAKKATAVSAPALLYGEPDLAIRVVRDIFNEDFTKLVVSGGESWDTLHSYIGHVAPDLVERMERWDGEQDAFAAYRIDEQLAKALERKVWLPSGGSLVIDRTEAMTVIDVNTGKFTGAGGNLEETITKNNLEAAEEIVRQLRLRDLGGIIVVDFIDMVLESNRELVLRRLLEALGRDRTKHQVAEVTSLGLVQMTRKRVGQGLLEVFSETCEVCGGRGILVHDQPVEKRQQGQQESGRAGRSGRGSRGSRGARTEAAAQQAGTDLPADTVPGGSPAGEPGALQPAADAEPEQDAPQAAAGA